jgi:hypothetical protein
MACTALGAEEKLKIKNSKDEHGNTAGMIYTAVTFVPNPYENNTIVELYGGYVNFCIFLAVMFFLGELSITSSSKYSLPPRRFIGGLVMCLFALIGNIFYMLVLAVIEALF